MNIDWAVIIEAVIEAISMCLDEGVPESQVAENIRDMGPIAKLRVGRKIRMESGWNRREWRQRKGEIFAELERCCSEMTDGDIAQLICEAKDCSHDH